MVVPIYVFELTTSERKRALPVVIWQFFVALGIGMSLMTTFVILPDVSWKAVSFTQALLSALGIPGLYSKEIPETHWQLLLEKRGEEAARNMRSLFPRRESISKYVRDEFAQSRKFARGVPDPKKMSWRTWRNTEKGPVWATITLQFLAGILVNSVYSSNDHTLSGGFNIVHGVQAGVTVICTFINAVCVNRFKRKSMLQVGSFVMATAALGAGLCDVLIKNKPSQDLEDAKVGATFFVMLFCAGYASTWALTWLFCVEHNVRTVLQYSLALSTSAFWFGNLCSCLLFPNLDEVFDTKEQFSYYFFICIISIVAFVFVYRETPLIETSHVPTPKLDGVVLKAKAEIKADSTNTLDEYASNFDYKKIVWKGSREQDTNVAVQETNSSTVSSTIYYYFCCDIVAAPIIIWASVLPIFKFLEKDRDGDMFFVSFVLICLLTVFAVNLVTIMRYGLRARIAHGVRLWKIAVALVVTAYFGTILGTISNVYIKDLEFHYLPLIICQVACGFYGILQFNLIYILNKYTYYQQEKNIQEQILMDNEGDVYLWDDLDLDTLKLVGTGNAEVYEVKTNNGHSVVVKHDKIRIEPGVDPLEAIKLKQQEAINLREVGMHPGIVRLFGSVFTKYVGWQRVIGGSESVAVCYLNLIMERCDGGTLQDFLDFRMMEDESIPLREILDFSIQITSALKFMHEKVNKVHYDLKPANIGLHWSNSYGGRWVTKLYDFGESDHNSEASFSAYRHRKRVGTNQYFAPETLVCRVGNPKARKRLERIMGKFESMDHILSLPWESVDVYAFSIILWQLLSNSIPYEKELHEEKMWTTEFHQKVIEGIRPMMFLTNGSKARTRLLNIVKQAWERSPSKRPSMASILKCFIVIRAECKEEINSEPAATPYPRSKEERKRKMEEKCTVVKPKKKKKTVRFIRRQSEVASDAQKRVKNFRFNVPIKTQSELLAAL
eukprot:CAMPEP_0114503074 /NCGR_PEP_ID=MMETSP0109-20121206/9450_1 /TAXON_ID=29199 /ORGANISM="Chlorarachnion reptans, Strain CCCM449" /LENGTH=950 /DNA_ID=CAMNT_0001681071 /DNA_START=389 /DNA_END=3241 /DNA_ORIENTATION=-